MGIQNFEINSQSAANKFSPKAVYPDIFLPETLPRNRIQESSNTVAVYLYLFIVVFGLYLFTGSHHLEDFDSINFAMAVNEYNVMKDTPHPPGAPVFIAVVKILTIFSDNVSFALTLASAFGGALFVIVWFQIFKLLLPIETAAIGTVMLAFSPGLWMTASRPMSDTLAVAVLAIVILLSLSYANTRRSSLLIWTAAAMALTVGIRPQFGFLIPLLLITTLFYFRPRKIVVFHVFTVFALTNLLWLIPTIVSQHNLDGDGWMTYFNQVLHFKNQFNEASGSPLFADKIQPIDIIKAAITHLGTLGYFALGLNLWYPDSIAKLLEGFGTTLNPWQRENTEWTYTGTLYTAMYVIGFCALLLRVRYYWKISRKYSYPIGYLLLTMILYWILIVMLIPPHTRFYIPLLPIFILLPLIGLHGRHWGHRMQYALVVSAILAASSTIIDSITLEAPPISMIKEIQQQTNTAGKNTALLLNSNGSRHARWYLSEAKIYGKHELNAPSSPDDLFVDGVRVFSNYPNAFSERLVNIEKLGSYHRPYRVWMRHTSTQLFELTLKPIPLADVSKSKGELIKTGTANPVRADDVKKASFLTQF